MKKIKVSELPPCTVLKGLYTLGTDANNNSVKVSLEFVEDKANAAQAAATAANTAATNATTAKNAANTAAQTATTAANNANTATSNANTARDAANTAASAANTAAATANKAATDATAAIQAVANAAKQTVDAAAAAAAKTASDAAKIATDAATDARTAEAAATEAAADADADAAATAATQATEQLMYKIGTLIPTGLSVEPVPRLTIGNTQPVYICAQLQPTQAAKNLIFISDNRAATVTQDGRITVISEGRSTIQIIPTLNTSLAKVIQVEVGQPTLRLVNTRTRLRLTAAGALRLN